MQQAVRDALIAFMAATAQAQAEATKEAQKAGIEHAKASGDGRYLGRKPSYSREQYQAVIDMLAQGAGISSISKQTELSRQAIYESGTRTSGSRGGISFVGVMSRASLLLSHTLTTRHRLALARRQRFSYLLMTADVR